MNIEFKLGRTEEIRPGVLDDASGKTPGGFQLTAIEELEKTQGVFMLLGSGFVKEPGNLHIAVILGSPGKKIIPGAGLGLGRKGNLQIPGSAAFPETNHFYQG
jgi:hypothetical protein